MLTRLHMPAGRAIALAAMPTAVLVGMGLSTPLAQADPQPEFKPGECVSQPDEPDGDGRAAGDEKTDDPAAGGKDEAGAPGASEPSPEPSSGSAPKPEPSPGAEDGGTEESSGASGSPAGTSPEPEPEPSPSESETRNPLDPLGIGEKIKDFFTGGGEEEAAEPSATASPSATPREEPSGTADEPADSARDSAGRAVDEVADAAGSAAGTAEEKAGKVKEAAEKTAGDVRETVAPSPSATAEDGPQPFPCPEYDAQALADAEIDPTPALLPDEPWILKSSKLSLHGLDYKGIVKVRTWSGKVKEVLKFTAGGVDIRDLHQLVQAPGGSTTHVKAAKGSNSTIRGGTVTMYTEELKGNLLGIIPITFSPESPPPLNLPEVFFTGVTVTQAGQFGGNLTVPGMNIYDGG